MVTAKRLVSLVVTLCDLWFRHPKVTLPFRSHTKMLQEDQLAFYYTELLLNFLRFIRLVVAAGSTAVAVIALPPLLHYGGAECLRRRGDPPNVVARLIYSGPLYGSKCQLPTATNGDRMDLDFAAIARSPPLLDSCVAHSSSQ